jgi:hypothetical protein
MISDRDLWQAALLLVKRYSVDAMLEAAARADQLLEEGDMTGG